MAELDHARLALLLSLADDELVIGHRHSEWTGWAPMIEADLAFSSIAQDEIAHAQLLYELAEPLDGRDPDALALGRPPTEYRNAIICEGSNREWGYTLARQYLYDTADDVRLESLERSSWTELAKAVSVIRLEERYHLDHARTWTDRLLNGPPEAKEHLLEGFRTALPGCGGIFEPLWEEEVLLRDRTLPDSSAELLERWTQAIGPDLLAHGLVLPDLNSSMGGRYGRHTPEFDQLWDDLTGLYRTHAGASW
ncbi:MAG TPA: 1,2-phenylacetyl-CoA epoxidase subunit PaaC [Actinomycetota bacterium]|nr:1,2-phenylacetyl-CoA epoxidase subunit PaaC [Actinomycetota bacterium]